MICSIDNCGILLYYDDNGGIPQLNYTKGVKNMATKAKSLHTCDMCGSTFKEGNNKNGEPNGISFIMGNGMVTVCNACVRKVGAMSNEEQDEFFDKLRKKVK